MSERELLRLQTVAGRLAAPPEPRGPQGRLVARGGDAELLAGLLGEIGETVLGRRLRFTTGSGARLRCDVWGRRLLSADPAPVAPPYGGLDHAGRLALRDGLAAALEGGGTLWVRAEPLPERNDPADLGLSLAALEALPPGTLALRPVPLSPPLPDPAGFAALEGLRPEALAWLRTGPAGETGRGGPPERIAALAALAGQELPAPLSGGAPGCLVLGAGESAVVIARAGGDLLLLLLPEAAAARVPALWRGAAPAVARPDRRML